MPKLTLTARLNQARQDAQLADAEALKWGADCPAAARQSFAREERRRLAKAEAASAAAWERVRFLESLLPR